MNRLIKGGFLTLSGVVGVTGMIMAAVQHPASAWVTPPGRMIISIVENGMLVPAILFLILLVCGLYLLLNNKGNTAQFDVSGLRRRKRLPHPVQSSKGTMPPYSIALRPFR